MHRELLLFFQSACIGAVLVVCYELLVVLRGIIPHSAFWVAAEDLLFWIFAGFSLFAKIYRENAGILRSFLFLGILTGAFFAKKITKRLLFWGKRCRIFVYKSAKGLSLQKKGRYPAGKRTGQVEKGEKKYKKKNNRL